MGEGTRAHQSMNRNQEGGGTGNKDRHHRGSKAGGVQELTRGARGRGNTRRGHTGAQARPGAFTRVHAEQAEQASAGVHRKSRTIL